MQTFKDRNGTECTIDITYGALQNIRRELGVDLLEIIQQPTLADSFLEDDVKLVSVIRILTGVPNTEQEILDFFETLDGDTIENAWIAVMEDLINFFPRKKRPVLQKIMTVAEELEAERMNLVEEKVEELRLEGLSELGKKSLSSPELQESTPDPSP